MKPNSQSNTILIDKIKKKREKIKSIGLTGQTCNLDHKTRII